VTEETVGGLKVCLLSRGEGPDGFRHGSRYEPNARADQRRAPAGPTAVVTDPANSYTSHAGDADQGGALRGRG